MKRLLIALVLLAGACVGPEEPPPPCQTFVITQEVKQPDGSVRVDTVGRGYVKTWYCQVPPDSVREH